MKKIEIAATWVVFVCVLVLSAWYLITPNLDYDEGYYIYGAQHILSGDIFIRGTGFDKPFLHPVFVSIGALLTAENYVGFRFMGWVFFLASFWAFYRGLVKIRSCFGEGESQQIPGWLWLLLLTGALVGVFVNPLTLGLGGSAMAEPLILLPMCLLLGQILGANVQSWARQINLYVVSFWIKGTILVWTPLLLIFPGLRLKEYFLKLKSGGFRRLRPALVVSALGLFYMMAGPDKLYPLRLISRTIFRVDERKLSLSHELSRWIEIVTNSLGSGAPAVFLLGIFAVCLSLYFVLKVSGWREAISRFEFRAACVFLGVIICYWPGMWFSGVVFDARFLVVLTPLFYFAVLFTVKTHWDLIFRSSARGFVLYKFVVFCFAALPLLFPAPMQRLKPPKVEDRAMSSPVLRWELPEKATLVTPVFWLVAGYVEPDVVSVTVPYDNKLNRHRAFGDNLFALYAFEQNSFFESIQYQASNGEFCPAISESKVHLGGLRVEEFKLLFLKSVMATNELEWTDLDFRPRPRKAPGSFISQFKFNFQEAHAGVEVSGSLRGKTQFFEDYPVLDLRGVLVFYRGRGLKELWGYDGWALGLRVESLVWRQKRVELAPFLPLTRWGKTIPLLPLSVPKAEIRPMDAGVGGQGLWFAGVRLSLGSACNVGI
ncbi:MAG: hypothetical protein N2578_06175 [Bdellovibrionaceae bacterium]|nr:hypothetical protein [Pseudobdellovibrionaceae bacterium]